jgi:membrane protein DedA with SNARE-associated domain
MHVMGHWYGPLISWYDQSLLTGGYPLIVLLMAIESSLLPLPSELVIPPAAILASGHQGGLTLPGVVIAGALGSLIGATAMYWGARLAGRPLVVRYGRYVFIPKERLEEAERWSARSGNFGVFVARLLPVVRHLIGLPSGIVRFSFARYALYTIAGSFAWCAILSAVGVAAGNNDKLMNGDLKTITLWTCAGVLALGALYYFAVYRLSRKQA